MKEKNLHYNKKGLLLSKKSFLERNILGLRNIEQKQRYFETTVFRKKYFGPLKLRLVNIFGTEQP